MSCLCAVLWLMIELTAVTSFRDFYSKETRTDADLLQYNYIDSS